jgi:hypothetical protein
MMPPNTSATSPSYEKEFQPIGIEESELVQSLADISWRLRRVPALGMPSTPKAASNLPINSTTRMTRSLP